MDVAAAPLSVGGDAERRKRDGEAPLAAARSGAAKRKARKHWQEEAKREPAQPLQAEGPGRGRTATMRVSMTMINWWQTSGRRTSMSNWPKLGGKRNRSI